MVDTLTHIDYYLYVLKSNTTTQGCVSCFSALGTGSRMHLYKFLKQHGKSTVSNLVNVIGLTQPTVSYHLAEMKHVGLLDSQKIGKEVYYMVSNTCKTYHQDCVLKDVHFPSHNHAQKI